MRGRRKETVTVSLCVLGSGERVDVTVQCDVTLDRLRFLFPTSLRRRPTYFIVSNCLLPHSKEGQLTVLDALPKFYHGHAPHNPKFLFHHVEYQTLSYQIQDAVHTVLCALIIQLSEGDEIWWQTGVFPLPDPNPSVCRQYIEELYECCSVGDSARLITLWDQWPQHVNASQYFSQSDPRTPTPLHIASENGHILVVQFLLDRLPLMDFDNSPLFRALLKNKTQVAAAIITHSPDALNCDESALDLLEHYPEKCLLQLVKETDHKALIPVPHLARRCIIAALDKKESELVRSLFETCLCHEGCVNYKDNMGWTLLHYAVTASDELLVDIMMNNHADPCLGDAWGVTPFILACKQGKVSLVPKLVIFEHLSNHDLSKGVVEALKYGHVRTVETLLQHFPPNARLEKNVLCWLVRLAQKDFQCNVAIIRSLPPLHEEGVILCQFLLEAARLSDVTTFSTLLAQPGVDVNFQDYMGHTALHEACLAGHVSLVEALCKRSDISVNVQNWRGETGLHYAAKSGHSPVVLALLTSHTVNPCLRDAAGRTALLSALHWNHTQMLALFLQHSRADNFLNIPDHAGVTVLHYASAIPRSIINDVIKHHHDKQTVILSPSPLPRLDIEKLSIYHCDIKEAQRPDWKTNSVRETLKERLSATVKYTCKGCNMVLCQSQVCSWGWVHRCPPKTVERKIKWKKKVTKDQISCPDSALHTAVKTRDSKLVGLLVTSKTDLEMVDEHGRTALELAIDLLLPDTVEAFLGLYKQHKPFTQSAAIMSLLNRALSAWTFDGDNTATRCHIIKILLNIIIVQFHGVVDIPSEQKHPLVVAAYLGRKDCIDNILQCDIVDDYTQPILAAILYGQSSILKSILEHLSKKYGEEHITHLLGGMYDTEGIGVLGKVVQTRGEEGLIIMRTILEYSPHIIDFPMRRDISMVTHSFAVSSGQQVHIDNCRGNTILELITRQQYETLAQRNLWEEVGCCLIDNGAVDSIVEVGDGKIIHASCAALVSATQYGFWKITDMLFARGDGRRLWKCGASSDRSSQCALSVGLVIDDIICNLSQSHVPCSLLVEFIHQGLQLEEGGEIGISQPGEAEESRLFWVTLSRKGAYMFDNSKSYEMLFKVSDKLSAITSPVDRAITLAMQPVIGWQRGKIRIQKYTPPFKLKAPPKRRSASTRIRPSPTVAVDRQVSEQRISTNTANVRNGAAVGLTQSNSGPRVVFTPPNTTRPASFMSPRSRKLARSHSLHHQIVSAMPTIFYLPPLGTPSPQVGGPMGKPGLLTGPYTYLSSVPNSPSSPLVLQSPLSFIDHCTSRKFRKVFVRGPIGPKMMLAIAHILWTRPGMTCEPSFSNWYTEWKVDSKSGPMACGWMADRSERDFYLVARSTIKMSSAAASHRVSVLHEACLHGQQAVVEKIIQHADKQYLNQLYCPDCHSDQYNTVTAIGMAARGGHPTIINGLLAVGIRPAWSDLMSALQCQSPGAGGNDERIIVSILQSLECCDEPDETLKHVVYLAAENNYPQALKIILDTYIKERCCGQEEELNPDNVWHQGTSQALLQALKLNHGEVAAVIFNFMSHNHLLSTKVCCQYLNLTAKMGQWSLCSQVLQFIPDGHTLLNSEGEQRTLHYAVAQNQHNFIEKFVSRFDIVSLHDETQQSDSVEATVQTTARQEQVPNHDDVKNETEKGACRDLDEGNFVQARSLINTLDSRGYTPLDYALHYGYTDIMYTLLIYGGVPNRKGIELWQRSSLLRKEYKICFRGTYHENRAGDSDHEQDSDTIQDSHSTVDDLLVRDLLRCARLGKNLLVSTFHAACCLGHLIVVKTLMAVRPCLLELSCYGKTPLFLAVLNGHVKVIEYLLGHGAQLTPLSLLQAWLLFSCRTKFYHPQNIYSRTQRLGLIREFQYDVNIHVSKTIYQFYKDNVRFMFYTENQANETCDTEGLKSVLCSMIKRSEPGENKVICDGNGLIYLALFHADPFVTDLVLDRVQLSEVVTATHWNRYPIQVPISIFDVVQALQPVCLADESMKALLLRYPTTTLHPLTLLACHRRDIQPFALVACLDNFTPEPGYTRRKWLWLKAMEALMKRKADRFIMESISLSLRNEMCERKEDLLFDLLLIAISTKNVHAVDGLLKLGAPTLNVDKSRKAWSAFHYSCLVDQSEVFDLLKRHLSLIDSVAYDRLSELGFNVEMAFIASARGNCYILHWLNNMGYNFAPQINSDESRTRMASLLHDPHSCLRTALLNGHEKTVKWLMQHKVQLEYEETAIGTVKKRSLYHYAASMKNETLALDIIGRLYEAGVRGLHARDEEGCTPADYAQMLGNMHIIDVLLQTEGTLHFVSAENPDVVSDHSYGALRHLLEAGPQEVEKNRQHLLRKKYKIDKTLKEYLSVGDDAMAHWMLKSRTVHWLKKCLLKKSGGKKMEVMLKMACHWGCEQSTKILLDMIQTLNLQTTLDLFPALSAAVSMGNMTCIQMLLESQMVSYKCQQSGEVENILHVAMKTCKVHVLEALLGWLDPTVVSKDLLYKEDKDGLTPMFLAQSIHGMQRPLSHLIGWKQSNPSTSTETQHLLQDLTKSENRKSFFRQIKHDRKDFILDVCALICEGKIPDNLLTLEEVLHRVVSVLPETAVRDIVSKLHSSQDLGGGQLSRWHGLTLAETAFMLGQLELCLWLEELVGGQFVHGEGMMWHLLSEMKGYHPDELYTQLSNTQIGPLDVNGHKNMAVSFQMQAKNASTPVLVESEVPSAVITSYNIHIRHRVIQCTLPKLSHMLKSKLKLDKVTITVDWESFGFLPHSESELIDEAVFLNIFHHSEMHGVSFAGLGHVIEDCSKYIETTKQYLGANIFDNFPPIILEHLKIQKCSASDLQIRGQDVCWLVDVKQGRVCYHPGNLPFWRPLKFAYQIAIEWSHSLREMSLTNEKRWKCQKIVFDWDSFFRVFPGGEMPIDAIQAVSSELNRLARISNSQIHFTGRYREVHLCLSEEGSLCYNKLAGVLNMALSLTKTETGWVVVDGLDAFLEEAVLSDLLDMTLVHVSDNLGSVDLYNLVDGLLQPVPTVVFPHIRAETMKDLVRNTVKDMAGPKCIPKILRELKIHISDVAYHIAMDFLFRMNTGLYNENNYLSKGARKWCFTEIDPSLLDLLHTRLPGFVCVQDRKCNMPLTTPEACCSTPLPLLTFDLKEVIVKGSLYSLHINPIVIETEWSLANRHCHDIANLILQDVETRRSNQCSTVLVNELFSLMPRLTREKNACLNELWDFLKGSDPFVRHQKVKFIKKTLAFCRQILAQYNMYQESNESTLPIWDSEPISEKLIKLWREKLKMFQTERKLTVYSSEDVRCFLIGLLDGFGYESEKSNVVCPSMCTLKEKSLHVVHFLLSGTVKGGEGDMETIVIELKGIQGNLVKRGKEENPPKVRILLVTNSQSLFSTKTETTICDDSQGLKVWFDGDRIRKTIKAASSPLSWYLDIQLQDCPIQNTPFYLVSKPTFSYILAAPVQEATSKLTVPVEEYASTLLVHDDVGTCRESQKSRSRVLARSKPSQYFVRRKTALELRKAGYRQIWKLGSIHGYSNNMLLCKVEPVRRGLFLVEIKPMKSTADNVMKVFCEKCGRYLKFVMANGLKESLDFMSTPGKPSTSKSKVVNKHGQVICPSAQPTWSVTAGGTLSFNLLPADKKGNTYMCSMGWVFTFVSSNGNDDDDVGEPVMSWFKTDESVLVLRTGVLSGAGEYVLHMNGKTVGTKHDMYRLMVQPGPVNVASSTVTDDFNLSKFTVILRDAYSNVVDPAATSKDLKVVFSPDHAKASVRHDKCMFNCSFQVDQAYHSTMLMSVTYCGKHLPGSPFTLKSTVRHFNARLQEFKKALEKIRKKFGLVELYVRRSDVMVDSFRAFQMMEAAKLHYPFKVEFTDEVGYDAGGLTREWYQLLSQEVFNPHYALFEKMEDGRYRPFHMSAVQENHLAYFKFCGQVFAKAILDGVGLDVHLVASFYKSILNIPTELSDLVYEDKTLYRNLSDLSAMQSEDDIAALCLTFAISECHFGSTTSLPLKPGGEDVEVTNSNCLEYIQLFTNYICNVRVQQQLENFKSGFSSVIPVSLMRELNHTELEFIMCGHSMVEIGRLQSLTSYEEGYHPNSNAIVWLWKLVESWSQAERKKLLQFVTGNSRIPASTRDWRLYIKHRPTSDKLPTAATCFNVLYLPAYKSEKQLCALVNKAVTLGCEGFGNF